MSCEQCGGSGWVIVRVGENEGVAPCPECRRTRPVEPRTPLTLPEATGLVDSLCDALSFAPTAPAARGVITSLVMEMCQTTDQLVYVVERTPSLHTKWDTFGVLGLRQILCSKYGPKDGYAITATEFYPDGRRNQERRKAIEVKYAIDSRCFGNGIGDTAHHGSEVTTQPANTLEQAVRGFLRLLRRPARGCALSSCTAYRAWPIRGWHRIVEKRLAFLWLCKQLLFRESDRFCVSQGQHVRI